MTDIATLGFEANSDELAAASQQLDRLSTSAAKTEGKVEQLNRAFGEQGAQTQKLTATQRAAEAAMTGTAAKTATATAAVKANTAAASQNASASKAMAASQKSAAASSAALGMSAKAQSAAMRQLPAQITDIITSLVSGQPAYLVAIQQGGQIKDSFGGMGAGARALMSVITPLRLVFTGLAGAVGAVAFGFVQGSREASELERALINTGGAAGVTAGQLNLIAVAQDNIAGSRAKATEVLGLLISTGRVFGEQLPAAVQATIEAERQLGIESEETVKAFAELGKDPVRASMKLNEVTHYLTLSVFEQISALERQGRTVDAAKLAQQAYADSLNRRGPEMEQKLGFIERAWRNVRDAASEAGDAIRNVGREESLEEELKRLETTRGSRPLNSTVQYGRGLRKFDDSREVEIRAIVKQREEEAKLRAESQATQEAAIRASDELQKMRDAALPKQGQLQKALQDYQRMADALAKAGQPIAAGKQAQDRANIVEKIFGKTSTVESKLSEIERTVAASMQAIGHSEAELEQKRAARQIKDDEYFRQRIANIQAETATKVAALRAENAIIQQEQAFGQKRIDNQNKVADNIAKIAMLQADATAQTKLLGNQQVIEADRIARSLDQARQSAQAYLDTLERANRRDLDDMGKGPAARRYSAGRNQIDDQALSQRQTLSSQLSAQQITPEMYEAQLGILNDYHQQAVAQWDSYYAQLEQRGADFATGFNDVVLSYLDSTRNLGATVANDLVGSLDSAASSLSNLAANVILFGEGGRAAVSQIAGALAQELLASLIRVGIQMGTNFLLGRTMAAAGLAAAAAQASAAAAMWTPAAIAANTATFGAASAAGLTAYTAALGAGQAATVGAAAAGGGFKEGGYTGDGPRSHVAGVVHKGEFVSDADVTGRYRPFLEHLQDGGSPHDFARQRPVTDYMPMAGQAQQAPAEPPIVNLKSVNVYNPNELAGEILNSDGSDDILINKMSRNSARYRSALGLQ